MEKSSKDELIRLHTQLIEIGRAVERLGHYKAALKIAEAAIEMNEAFTPEGEEEADEVKQIRKLLPLVVERIKERMNEKAKDLKSH